MDRFDCVHTCAETLPGARSTRALQACPEQSQSDLAPGDGDHAHQAHVVHEWERQRRPVREAWMCARHRGCDDICEPSARQVGRLKECVLRARYLRAAAMGGGGSGSKTLRYLTVLLVTCLCSVAASGVSMRPVGSGGECLAGPWLFPAKCQILSRQDIPVVTVGLFDSEGAPCCAEAVTTVEVALVSSHNGKAESIRMTGFLVRDSVSGEPGAAMTLEFSGLRTKNPVAGAFDLTFSAFYNGAPLEYRAVLHIMPDTLLLRSSLVFGQKFAVHDVLPSLTLEMIGRNTTIAGGGGLRIKTRLFNKGDMSDISGSSLLGVTSVPFEIGGSAIFADLSTQRAAGHGFRLAFFIEGSEKQCVSGVARVTCSKWEQHRGPLGGLGGYWVEILSPMFILLPDMLVLSTEILSLNNIAKVDASLPLYTVFLYDSQFPSEKLEIVADDGLELTVSLVSQSDAYPVEESNLEGTKTAAIVGNSARFNQLVVRSISGPAFRLRFTASWNDFCSLGNRDPSCSGKCCLFTPGFAVYPYAMQMSPRTVPDLIVGDAVGNFTVEFVDYNGLRLGGIGSAWELLVAPHVVHQAAEVGGKLAAEVVPKVVSGGQATFVSLVVKKMAGRDVSLRFEEMSSSLQVQTSGFAIYPFALKLPGPVLSAVAGQPIPLAIEMHDNEGQVLDSINLDDGFLVRADAFKLHNISWVPCGCLGETGAVGKSGIATFTELSMSTIGRFKLNLTLARGSFSSLSLQTAAFDVVAAAIVTTNSSITGVYSMGDVLGDVTIMLAYESTIG